MTPPVSYILDPAAVVIGADPVHHRSQERERRRDGNRSELHDWKKGGKNKSKVTVVVLVLPCC
jgi:hypothetical protein